MFDLDHAIAEWRRQMSAAGVTEPNVLDELEGHLRDDLEGLQRSGLDAHTAFEDAVRRLGQAAQLTVEFRKAGGRIRTFLQKLSTIVANRSDMTVPPFEDWTPNALETLALARKEPLRFHHDYIGTEHLLLGLLRVDRGIVTDVLRALGVDRDIIVVEIEKIVGIAPAHESAPRIPFTPRARKALTLAGKEAKALNHAYVSSEHIFLGLLVEGSGVAALVLRKPGVQLESVRQLVRNRLEHDQPGDLGS